MDITEDLFYKWLDAKEIIEDAEKEIFKTNEDLKSLQQNNGNSLSSHDIDWMKNKKMENDELIQKTLNLRNDRKNIEIKLISIIDATVLKYIIITPKSKRGTNVRLYVENGKLMYQDSQ